jgi:DNA processing protein
MEDLVYKIALTLLHGVGEKTAKKLVAYCGGAEAVFKEKKTAIGKISGINSSLDIPSLASEALKRAEEEIKFIQKQKINPLFYLDDEYPVKLKYCDDSPVMLYCKGNFEFSEQKIISIVGTRKATDYGKIITEKIVEGFVGHDVLIVSGLAYGIDITAHKAALKFNIPTIGVLAHGLDRIYPPVHKPVSDEMLENGGLLTEYLSGTNPDRENFPTRNRIVAGLADATLVTEAGVKGGALITAALASSYNRDVFAVPGKVGDAYSEGCNKLIKKNVAALIESADDVIEMMGWKKDEKKLPVQKQLFVELNSEEEKIVVLLKENGTMAIDHISLLSGITASKASAMLLNLEFSGVVKALPGKMFQLT